MYWIQIIIIALLTVWALYFLYKKFFHNDKDHHSGCAEEATCKSTKEIIKNK